MVRGFQRLLTLESSGVRDRLGLPQVSADEITTRRALAERGVPLQAPITMHVVDQALAVYPRTLDQREEGRSEMYHPADMHADMHCCDRIVSGMWDVLGLDECALKSLDASPTQLAYLKRNSQDHRKTMDMLESVCEAVGRKVACAFRHARRDATCEDFIAAVSGGEYSQELHIAYATVVLLAFKESGRQNNGAMHSALHVEMLHLFSSFRSGRAHPEKERYVAYLSWLVVGMRSLAGSRQFALVRLNPGVVMSRTAGRATLLDEHHELAVASTKALAKASSIDSVLRASGASGMLRRLEQSWFDATRHSAERNPGEIRKGEAKQSAARLARIQEHLPDLKPKGDPKYFKVINHGFEETLRDVRRTMAVQWTPQPEFLDRFERAEAEDNDVRGKLLRTEQVLAQGRFLAEEASRHSEAAAERRRGAEAQAATRAAAATGRAARAAAASTRAPAAEAHAEEKVPLADFLRLHTRRDGLKNVLPASRLRYVRWEPGTENTDGPQSAWSVVCTLVYTPTDEQLPHEWSRVTPHHPVVPSEARSGIQDALEEHSNAAKEGERSARMAERARRGARGP